MTSDFLKDQIFLNKLNDLKIKNQYVKLTILSWSEQPLTEIQGKAISGSLNISGSSSVRRTANFSMFAEEKENDLTQIDQQLSINRKVKLEIGFKNTVPPYKYEVLNQDNNILDKYEINYQEKYGDIVWFPLGIFVIFDPNISHQVGSGVTISVTLKDKMCLLNGEAGGKIPAAVTFSEREDEYGEITQPLIIQIIQELVNHFGAEDAAKIIIEDLDEQIKQVVKYIGSTPIYTIEIGNGVAFYFTQDDFEEAISKIPSSTKYFTHTYKYGNDIGFVMVDFVYPGQLVCNPGETVTSVLDKIISVLGNFEYFYDAYGYFHFQEIKNYLNITQYTTILKHNNQEIPYETDFSSGKSVYTFQGTKLITAINNAPKYSNVKNDFVVWGIRKSADGNSEIPIRYHLAIDHRPEIGQNHLVSFYVDDYGITRANAEQFTRVYSTKAELPNPGHEHTVYIVGTLENPTYYRWDDIKQEYIQSTDIQYITTVDWREELYYQGIQAQDTGSAYPYYFTELINEWPKLFNLKTQQWYDSVVEDPSSVDFFLDMIDDDAAVGQYNVQNIGRRSEVVSEDKINCVFEQDVPDVVFLNTDELSDPERKAYYESGQQPYYQIDNTIASVITIGGSQNSCYQRICEMLYQYTHMNESISISALPIYYLQPNTRITVIDNASGINGDFIINQISLPLDVSSTMNISAYKALTKI